MGYPLEGVRVVALEQAVAAPFCTRHLADLGADVVKIERPDGGDFGRRYDTVVNGMSSYFVWLNRGKRSLTLDLKSEGGRALLTRLLDRADVFIQNLGPGVADRLGLAAATLRERYPRLIVCELSGYGSTGPYRDRKAFDLLLQGESGLISTTGHAGGAGQDRHLDRRHLGRDVRLLLDPGGALRSGADGHGADDRDGDAGLPRRVDERPGLVLDVRRDQAGAGRLAPQHHRAVRPVPLRRRPVREPGGPERGPVAAPLRGRARAAGPGGRSALHAPTSSGSRTAPSWSR